MSIRKAYPEKTKRIKGQFTGMLAYVEKPVQDWMIKGKPTTIEGGFDLYCAMKQGGSRNKDPFAALPDFL